MSQSAKELLLIIVGAAALIGLLLFGLNGQQQPGYATPPGYGPQQPSWSQPNTGGDPDAYRVPYRNNPTCPGPNCPQPY